MNIPFDAYHSMEPSRIYLASPDGTLLTALNGIQPDSASLKLQLGNTWELSFTVDRWLSAEGGRRESGGYQLLDEKMRLYAEHIGWFIMKAPSVSNDGTSESKSVEAESAEIEWVDKSLKGFKINCGTTDSMEMLIPGNTEITGGVEFARKQIRFCDKEHPELSLLHIAMKAAGLTGWDIGYVDEIPKVYTAYENGKPVEKTIRLKDEIGVFDLNSSGLYSFFTQDLSKFFECLFIFDIQNYRINVYRAEHLGKDTNVTISFRNFQNSNDISCSNPEDICTCCYVSGGDDLGIEQVNFGWNYIEDKSYFLNTRYLPAPLIAKYNEWKQYMESRRYEYIDLTRRYSGQLDILSELENRVPLDDCSTDWNKFSDEKLLLAKDNYTAQKAGLESFYVDENGDFDEAKLASSDDADTYYQVRDVILPSIAIEIANRGLPSSVGKQDYIDSYLTDWKLYGTSELSVKLEMYQNQKEVCEAGHYDLPYEEYEALTNGTENAEAQKQYPPHTRDMHEQMHEQYEDAVLQLDDTVSGTCALAYAQRTLEYGDAERLAEQIFEERATLVEAVTKETWSIEGVESFTPQELETLSRLDSYTDYVNDNMFLTDSDDTIKALDERLRLLDAAKADLEATSRPQYDYDTSLEHFISDYAYRELTRSLELGDFLYLEAQENYYVKLRLISLSYNPLLPTGSLSIGFSSMLITASRRYDTTYLLDLRGYSGRNQISGTPGSSLKNKGGVTLLPELLEKIFSSTQYTGNIQNTINQHFQSIIGQLVVAKGLEAEMIKAADVSADNGFFQYLQSALIAADKIVADSGEFKTLSALIGAIDSLLSGTVSAELGHIIRLTAENVRVDEAVIRDLIAANITVAMLQAGDISADKFHIASEDGGLNISGNTMQFRDKKGVVRIQIGRDARDAFTFCLYDESGKGVLIDADGVKESALSDGLIKNEMLAGGITKDKLGFKVVNTDANGKVNASEVTLNGQGLDMKFTSVDEGIRTLTYNVNENAKSITAKVTQTDITNSIDDYDQSSISSIRDRVTQTETGIGGITSELSDVKNTVSKKADGSQITTLSEKIAKSIENFDGFQQTVTAVYATKDSLKDYATTKSVTSSLSQTAESIRTEVSAIGDRTAALEVSAGKISTQVNTNTGDISTVTQTAKDLTTELKDARDGKTSLKVKLGEISASVTEAGKKAESVQSALNGFRTTVESNYATNTSVDGKVNGVSVGARNLACKTNQGSVNWVWSMQTGGYTSGSLTEDNINCCIFTRGDTPQSGWSFIAYTDIGRSKLKGNTDYMVAFDVKPSTDTVFSVSLKESNGSNDLCSSYTAIQKAVQKNRWNRIVYQCRTKSELPSSTAQLLYLTSMSSAPGVSYLFKDLKIEEGNKPTSYTEAPEDTAYNISSVEQKAENYNIAVKEKIDGVSETISAITVSSKEISTRLESHDMQFEEISNESKDFKNQLSGFYTSTEINSKIGEISTQITDAKGDFVKQSSFIADSAKWQLVFKNYGMYDGGEIDAQETAFQINADGFSIESHETGQKTIMSPEEFSGWYKDEKVFYLNQDETFSKRLTVKNGIDMNTVKYVPIKYSVGSAAIGAIAHVKSSGTL